MALKLPGCKDCAKTAHGGRSLSIGVQSGEDRYEVRGPKGAVLFRSSSVVAAATFMRGHPGTTVHTVTLPDAAG